MGVVLRNLSDVQCYFTSLGGSIAWLGKTHLLCRGTEQYVPNFFVIPTTPAGIHLCQTATVPYCLIDEDCQLLSKEPVRILAFEPDALLEELAVQKGWQLLTPDWRLIHRLSDKTELPTILGAASVPIIPCKVVANIHPSEADTLWNQFASEGLVVQEAKNNLTGRGTHFVDSREALRDCLRHLAGTSVKVSKFIRGRLFTISACVTGSDVYTSYLSIQLVGNPHLTDWWAAHCGNELVDETLLTKREVNSIKNICEQVGLELAQQGFAGHFGLDMVLSTDGIPYVLEINPRIQSVSSLVSIAEIERGALPLQAIHILAFCHDDVDVLPEIPTSSFPSSSLSQIIIAHQGEDEIVRRELVPGVYTVEQGVLQLRRAGADMLSMFDPVEVLITPFCSKDDVLSRGQRLAVIQKRGRVTDQDANLLPEMIRIAELLRAFVLSER